MKKVSKVISVLMAAIMALSVFVVSATAVATPLIAGNTKETATNIPSYGTEYVSELSKAGETDWFKFTTLSEDAYYTITLENYNIEEDFYTSSYLYLYLYDTYSKELACIRTINASKNVRLENNTTYYLKAMTSGNLTGNYEILISYKLDPVPNIKEEATIISVNNTYKYSLDGTGDVDWFKFTAPVNDTYKISCENYNISEDGWDEELNLYVYDVYNKELAHIRRTGSTDIELEKDITYYVKVVMGPYRDWSIGDYDFSVKCDSAKSLSKITVDSIPSKTTYAIGERFDKTGLKVTAHYSDGSTKAVTSCTFYGFDSSTAGTKTLTVSYTENDATKTASFNITVEETDNLGNTDTGFDFLAVLTAIWNFFVGIFNFIIGLFA